MTTKSRKSTSVQSNEATEGFSADLEIAGKKSATKRRSFSFEEKKKKNFKRLETESRKSVCMKFNLDNSVLQRWIDQKSKIQILGDSTKNLKHFKKNRGAENEELDHQLYLWFIQARARKISVSGPILKTKALHFAKELGIHNFKAGDGWFAGWKRRNGIRLLSVAGERLSADPQAAESFKRELLNIRQSQEFVRAQIFNFDETGLTFKTLPDKTFVSSDEICAPGFKKDKNRITVGACSNADGSFKLPLVIISKSENPRALKNCKASLPVYYTHQKNSWMTTAIFEAWFHQEFVPRVQTFLRSKNLPTKVLLLVDNFRAHVPIRVNDIEVRFLPPNVTSLIQPMDQGILETLKRRYKSRLFSSIIDAENRQISVSDYLKTITLREIINWINDAWINMSSTTIYKCWSKIWIEETCDATTQTEKNSSSLTLLDASVAGESVEQMIHGSEHTVAAVTENLRCFKAFEQIDELRVYNWMTSVEEWANDSELHNLNFNQQDGENQENSQETTIFLPNYNRLSTSTDSVDLPCISKAINVLNDTSY